MAYLRNEAGAIEARESFDEYQRVFGGASKRIFDIVFAVLALIAFLPLMLVIAVISRFYSCGPVFYVHQRIGFGGRPFGCIKFRTMCVDGDRILEEYLQANPEARAEYCATHKLANDPRVIPVIGTFLRKSSLDELPQLFNVLRGDMSLVGPRPVIEAELVDYGQVRSDYIRTRPGITGVWQISGRSNISFDERVAMDHGYLEQWSLLRDLWILIKTAFVVVRREGAY